MTAPAATVDRGRIMEALRTVKDPELLVDWMTFKEALTNAIIAGRQYRRSRRNYCGSQLRRGLAVALAEAERSAPAGERS